MFLEHQSSDRFSSKKPDVYLSDIREDLNARLKTLGLSRETLASSQKTPLAEHDKAIILKELQAYKKAIQTLEESIIDPAEVSRHRRELAEIPLDWRISRI